MKPTAVDSIVKTLTEYALAEKSEANRKVLMFAIQVAEKNRPLEQHTIEQAWEDAWEDAFNAKTFALSGREYFAQTHKQINDTNQIKLNL